MSGERILVCDDDRQILRALRLMLREAGYEVLTREAGEGLSTWRSSAGPTLRSST